MKKFVAGVAVGALIFGAVPVFADSIKTLVGTKVTGVYSVEQKGKKIADGAVINGSAYVPVRAIADATGTSISVEGKKITLGDGSVQDDFYAREGTIKVELDNARDEIKRLEDMMPNYQKNLEEAETRLATSNGQDPAAQPTYDIAKKHVDETIARIDALKQRVKELEDELRNLK